MNETINKYEAYYCSEIARLNLLFVDKFSKDFLENVSSKITEIIFNYITDNDTEFDDFIREVFENETIWNYNTNIY